MNKNKNTKKEHKKIPNPFEVGLPIQMDVYLPTGKPLNIQVSIVGWCYNQFLLIKADYDSRFLVISKGSIVKGKYIYDGTVYEFETHIVQIQKEPAFMWYLKFPEEFKIKLLRTSDRIPLRVRVVDHNGLIYYSKDISSDGIALYLKTESHKNQTVGSKLDLSFKILEDTYIRNLNSEIIRLYSEEDKDIMGLKFDPENTDELEKISSFIDLMAGYINK